MKKIDTYCPCMLVPRSESNTFKEEASMKRDRTQSRFSRRDFIKGAAAGAAVAAGGAALFRTDDVVPLVNAASAPVCPDGTQRSEEHTSELQSRFGILYAVFRL